MKTEDEVLNRTVNLSNKLQQLHKDLGYLSLVEENFNNEYTQLKTELKVLIWVLKNE